MSFIVDHYNYWIVVLLMMMGFYVVIAANNLVKKIVGLNIFQTSVFMMYISIGKVNGGSAPIAAEGITTYSNPLPHVLILTAIVVGVATTAVGLALVVRIKRAYGTVEENEFEDKEDLI
ncbi:cation:proton antiporter subunit C [Psychrobium sp. 1_MG-2023]|uniref:cation:proton antiporter subunit C n=1 Tax=Psychrobium sp. 1_MG-2023 TaxID=3062624 RepID=UPI000C34375D|nr:cation:proton antiporter subunit C [Psychrobium sp. 1_MG-2023]MDP2560359.1 cation:proton antiporter subunit C [Psychrobium sp. 1_MG-2023]PKF55469.1 Na+/H+ antiporter subunit C [Alteromonadales bacterium alter-6D02]